MREYATHMRGAALRLEREHKASAWQAHTTAALSGVSGKNFPSLDELIGGGKSSPKADDMLQMARRWDVAVNMNKAN